MEIENNEYIRTKEGYICRIDKIDECKYCEQNVYIYKETIGDLHFEHTYHKGDITKHSKNIINLLEVGDIVKVYVFADISDDDSEAIETYYRIESKYEITELKESVKMNYAKILSILTKEKYEQYSYKL